MREATSPEVTDDEDETRRVAAPLVWESTRLRYLKRDLDADYRDGLKIQARRQKATVLQSQDSSPEELTRVGHFLHI